MQYIFCSFSVFEDYVTPIKIFENTGIVKRIHKIQINYYIESASFNNYYLQVTDKAKSI